MSLRSYDDLKFHERVAASYVVVRALYTGKYSPGGGISADVIRGKQYEKGKKKGRKCKRKRKKGETKRKKGEREREKGK
jgi:hypothetical protein